MFLNVRHFVSIWKAELTGQQELTSILSPDIILFSVFVWQFTEMERRVRQSKRETYYIYN